MKNILKKLLCIVLAVIMAAFCLASCKKGTEDVDTSSEGDQTTSPSQTGPSEPPAEPIKNSAFGIEIKDAEALLALFGIDGVDIKDVKLDLTSNKQGKALLSLGAKLFDEEHDLKIFSGDNIAITSSLLDKAYGITDVEAFSEALDVMMIADALVYGDSAGTDISDVKRYESFYNKYYAMLISELKTNSSLAVSEDGGITTLSGNLTSDALATVYVNLTEELYADEEFYTLFGIDKESFLEGKPDKDTLLQKTKDSFAEVFSEMQLEITVNSLKMDAESIKSFDIAMKWISKDSEQESGQEKYTASILFDMDAKTFSFDISNEPHTDYAKISVTSEKIEADVNTRTFYSINAEEDGISLDSTTTVKLKLTADKSSIDLSANVKSTNEYPTYEQAVLTESDVVLLLGDNKLKLDYKTQIDAVRGSTDDPDEIESEAVEYHIDAALTETGGEAMFKSSSAYTSSAYPEDNYSESTEMTAKLTRTENSLKLEIKSGDETGEATLTDNGTELVGTLSENGEELGNVRFIKAVEGTKTTYTLLNFTAKKVTTDLSAIGISFYIDTDAETEDAPSFSPIDDMTEDELNEIVEGIKTRNEALFGKLEDAFKAVFDKPNTLTMATSANYPPYEYEYDGEIIGIDVEIAEKIAEKLGMELEVVDTRFENIIDGVASGRYDIGMAGMVATEARLEEVSFSKVYASDIHVAVVKNGSSVKTLDDLANAKIGVVSGTLDYSYVTYEFGTDNVYIYYTGAAAAQALKNGKIDVIVIDYESAKKIVSSNAGTSIIRTAYSYEDYSIAVAKENTELLDRINDAIDELIADGTIDEILSSYALA